MKKRYILAGIVLVILLLIMIPPIVSKPPSRVLLSFDVELVDSYQTLAAIIPILEKNNVKATFFVTGRFAENNEDIISYFAENNHEVACNSYDHSLMTDLTKDAKKEQLEKCADIIKKIINPVDGDVKIGFKAPEHSIDAETFDLLKELGFSYDASVIQGLSLFYAKPTIPEIPLSSYLMFPIEDYLFIGTFKMPDLFFWIAKAKRGSYISMLMHPRYISGHAKKLNNLLSYYKTQGAEFVTHSEFLRTSL